MTRDVRRFVERAACGLAAALMLSGCITINLPGAMPEPLLEQVVYGDSGPKILLVQIEGVLNTNMPELGDDPTATITTFLTEMTFSEAALVIQALNKAVADA